MTDRIDHGAKPWKAIPREALRDKRLSAQGKGGLVTLLSHDAGWVRSVIAILMKENRRCGRQQARLIMRELVENGYAELTQSRGAGGKFTTGYTVFAESRSAADTSSSPGAVDRGAVSPGAVDRSAVVEPQEVEPQEVEPQEPKPAAHPRDPVWDGFVAWLGRSPETKSERGTWNKAAAELRTIHVDDALEVERRGRAYQRLYSGVVPTPLGLVAHWSEVGPSPASPGDPWKPSIAEMTDEELAEAAHG